MHQSSKVTTKYQATIPKEIRTKLDLKAGDYVLFEDKSDEIVISKVKNVDWQYLKAISSSLEAEWLSEADEEAYGDL
jgi:antitoxin PrlF